MLPLWPSSFWSRCGSRLPWLPHMSRSGNMDRSVSAAPKSLWLVFTCSPLTFSLCPQHTVLSSVFPLSQILWHILQNLPSLSSFTIRLPWVPGHSSLPGKDTADKVDRRNALIMLSVVPCSLSTLTSRNHSYFFSDWRRIVSFKFFDTQAPSIFTGELYFLVTLAVSSLVCTATDTTFF